VRFLWFKSRDYGRAEPQLRGRSGIGGMFAVNGGAKWTDDENYVSRTNAVYFQCPVSRRCLEIRAEKLASITLTVEGSKRTKKVLSTPNFRDRTMSNLLRNVEMDLGIGGDGWLWLNKEIRERPVLEALRPDFMIQEPAQGRILYDPSAKLTGTSNPEMIFYTDPDEPAAILMVERRIGDTNRYEQLDADLLHISVYNPLSAIQGSGAGDAILADIAAYRAATKLMYARFANGGRKSGWITIPEVDGYNELTDDDKTKLRSTLQMLRDDDELKGLVAGSEFIENQMDFKELDVVQVVKALERRIAMAFAVQPVMLGFEGETTGMNMRTADRTFYTGWLKPRADFVLGHIQSFLSDSLDDQRLTIAIDETRLPYLQDDKLDMVDKMAGRGAITFNEYREAMGFAPAPWGDVPIPVAGAGETIANSGDKGPGQQSLNQPAREVGHDADTSGRASQRA
jgi:hypothetical protein